ncbi:Cas10/Cmr2 second palm domain-containing protein [Armatimonas sp.]|uniref:Cas10/Cmr2 second palm domain-containing protein n=1 Tax=Armatimonas sp. TaxID=1872638 RepID=UPI00374D8B26
MPFVCLIDTAGIQEYIYARNELRSIADASGYLKKLTEPGGLFREVVERHGVSVIFAAGGNIALRAETKAPLQAVCKEISRELIVAGKGLEIVAAIESYEEKRLAEGYLKALALLEQRKLTQTRNVPFTFPGLSGESDSPTPRKSKHKSGYILPTQTDAQLIMRCSGEESDLMAVVSMDGIGMGKKLQSWMQGVLHEDARFESEFKLWSEYIQKRWDAAWERAVDELEAAFPSPYFLLAHQTLPERELKLWWDDEGNPYLPCRKIYQGGDDLTFLCDARIALGFTRNLIGHLEAPQHGEEATHIPEIFHRLSVSAGIVFVNAHFPFRRAVRMAEAIQKRAKKVAVEESDTDPKSRMDWWLNRTGALERPDVGALATKSSLRPAALEDWDQFESEELTGAWRAFAESRNKLKALGEAAQDGAEAVQEFLALRGVPDPENPKATVRTLDFLPRVSSKTGFDNNRETVLVDITELFDIHFPLPQSATEEVAA